MQNSGPAFLNQIRKMAEEVSAREGCTLYDLEFVGGGGNRTLRVYIDKNGGENVSIDDCSNVSRGLNLALDTEDMIPGGAYNLEVSSPGLERALRERWHYEKAVGQKVNVRTFAPLVQFNETMPELGKAKQATGPLKAVDEAGIRVEMGERDVFVPFEQITKAHTVFEFEEPEKPKKGKKK